MRALAREKIISGFTSNRTYSKTRGKTQGTGNSYNKIHFARNRQAPVSTITGGTASPRTNDTFVTCASVCADTHDDGKLNGAIIVCPELNEPMHHRLLHVLYHARAALR